jgi:hypothetical protein
MVFRVGGIDIIVITNNGQAVDLGQFTSLGIDPNRCGRPPCSGLSLKRIISDNRRAAYSSERLKLR